MHSLNPFNNSSVFTERVLYARPCSSGLGYTQEENEDPGALQSAEILQSEGMDMCLHV